MAGIDVDVANPYAGYAYAYPHKTVYERLTPPVNLKEVWDKENKRSLFLYIHIPFCERRCAFCNLFSCVDPRSTMVSDYIRTVRRHGKIMRGILGDAAFARIAFGGGTPTFLDPRDLATLFHICRVVMGADAALPPASVETSPATATSDRLNVLKDNGVDRISIGVQSFERDELSVLSRFLDLETTHRALMRIKRQDFRLLNMDLIYGIPGQTPATWKRTLFKALEYEPDELYLYPLYFRPRTGMWRQQGKKDFRLTMYREAATILAEAGYTRDSMRSFRLETDAGPRAPDYSCQEDGMIGLGCGPRSYTRTLHYSSEYAVDQSATRRIIRSYMSQSEKAFGFAHHGFHLNEEEQKRRHVIKSILKSEGLRTDHYYARFKSDVFSDLPELHTLVEKGWARITGSVFHLEPEGIELSDALGPFLYSREVKSKMAAWF